MKLYPKLFFSLILILTACEKNADINEVAQFPLEENPSSVLEEPNKISYEESLSKWIELKRNNGNSYIYQTTFISWVGFGNTTELKIIENKVVARNYRAFTINSQTQEHITTATYSENENNLGSHNEGVLPRTIDELYTTCANEYLVVDPNENQIFFKANNDGLMIQCGFVPDNCADDCFKGITIDFIKWID